MFVLKAGALLLRVEQCLLGPARLVDSGLARLNNTDQRIVIQKNNVRGRGLQLPRPATGPEGKHLPVRVSSLTRPAVLNEDNLPR